MDDRPVERPVLHRVYQIFLCVLLLAAPLAVGGVHTSVVVGLGALALVIVALQTRLLHAHKIKPTLVSIPSMAFWFLALICLIQLLPLPQTLIERLSPARWAHFQQGWQVLFPGEAVAGAWMPLSVDPAQTADRGLRWLTIGTTALIATNHARLPHAWRDVLRALTASGLLVLLVGAIQTLAGTDKILFYYLPQAGIKSFATFVNPNQAAVFYGICALCAFALAFKRFERHLPEALGASAAGLILMVAMAEQDSTGALLGFSVALLALGGFFLQGKQSARLIPRNRARKAAAILLSVPILAPVLTFLALKVGPERLGTLIGDTALGLWAQERGNARLEMMAAALDGALDYPALGAGAGATARGLAAYIDWSKIRPASIPTIENEPIQWLFEFGWLPTALAMLLLATYLWFAARGHLRGRTSRYGVGLAVGIFVAINTQFHFPFFALGLAIPAVFLLESAIARRPSSSKTPLKRGSFLMRTPRLRAVYFGALLALMAAFIGANSAYHIDFGSLDDHSESKAASYATQTARLARLNRLIPTDGDLYARAAQIAARSADPDHASRLAAHAAQIEPTANLLLFSAGKYWLAGQKDQALKAYQQVFSPAYLQVPHPWLTRNVYPIVRDPESLAMALKNADARAWEVIAEHLRREQGPRAAAEFALQLVELRPDHYQPYRLLILNYQRTKNYALAELWARLLISHNLTDANGAQPAGYALLAQSIIHQRGRDHARAVILKAIDETGINQTLGELLIRWRTPNPGEASAAESRAIASFRKAHCTHPTGRQPIIHCWTAEGWLAERDRRLDDARFAYRRIGIKFGDPRPFGAFLARNGLCIELNELIARLAADNVASPGLQNQVKRMTRDCARNARAE